MENTARLPCHVAIIMDGNGRWAAQRGLSRLDGHRAGVKKTRPILKYLREKTIPFVTLYVFSTENWNRPQEEVNGILNILESVIAEEAIELHRNNVKIRHIGRTDGVSPGLQKSIKSAIRLTKNNSGMTLGFAFNYGGRAEILDAIKKISADGIPTKDLNESTFNKYLYTADFPDADLVIRTGGEIRTSNFLIWQAAYAEYYFTPVLWPDFDENELEKALLTYSQRQRRFGGLGTKA